MSEPQTMQPGKNSLSLSSDLIAVHLGGCLTPEQIVAGASGELSRIDQDTVMAHLAACPACSEQYNQILGDKAQKPTVFSHGRWRWWLLAAAIIIAAPVLFWFGSGTEAPVTPPPKPVTAAPATAPAHRSRCRSTD